MTFVVEQQRRQRPAYMPRHVMSQQCAGCRSRCCASAATRPSGISRQSIVAGYSNDVMAYIPAKHMPAECYEVVDSMTAYGHPGPFAPDVEERVFAGTHKAAKQVRLQ